MFYPFSAIPVEEKSEIKKMLLLRFNEPVQQIAVQIAVLIGNIARYDCPQDWMELVPTLVEVVQSNDLLVQHRGLLILLHVVKVLASKRFQRDRNHFEVGAASKLSRSYFFLNDCFFSGTNIKVV